jgi:hypothetical protein
MSIGHRTLGPVPYTFVGANRQYIGVRPANRVSLRIQGWTLTTLREKLINFGAKVVNHSKHVLFQLGEVSVPRQLFGRILGRIARLCPACASG